MVLRVKQDTTATLTPCVQIAREASIANVAQVTVEMEFNALVGIHVINIA